LGEGELPETRARARVWEEMKMKKKRRVSWKKALNEKKIMNWNRSS
jgi:hypothetical protein